VQVFRGHRALVERLPAPAVAIGMFDGVHRGHQALIRRAVAAARAATGTAVAFTFDPHPSAVLAPDAAPPMLTSLDRRLELMAEAGLDAVVVEPFTLELSKLPAPDFVDQILVRALGVRHVVVGWDWHYGHARAGTIDTLTAHGARAGFTVDPVDAVVVDGTPVSSTRIRGLVKAADLAAAARLLGRPYDVTGAVVHGAERGRAIGIPTANVAPDVPVIAPTGIYAAWLCVDGARLPTATSLGTNPTFVTAGAVTLEAHVLDWTGDLYDRRVRVELVERLRGEEKFATVDALVGQIRRDIDAARDALRNSRPGVSVS
jgi:riboflavin kinase / FMN adenylyltransferase